MFETGVPSEAVSGPLPQLPHMLPTLTPAARARIEEDLRERRAELLEGISRHEAALASLESSNPERAARARQNLALLDGELSQTNAALQRLAAGTYGICERCGALIPPRRLQVVPSALRCGTCTAH